MAYSVVANSEAISRAVVASYNRFRREIVESLTTYPHADVTSLPVGNDYRAPAASAYVVTAADASSLATLRTLCRDIYRVWTAHIADETAHAIADVTNVIASGLPADDADQTALNTFLNQAKAAFAHVSESGVHFTDDGVNAISSADATDAGTSYTLANEVKVDLNSHIQFAPASPAIVLLGR